MSDDIFDIDGYSYEDDVALDADERDVAGTKQEWLKMTSKGQTIRCAFVYFYTYESNAIRAAIKAARKEEGDKKPTREEIVAVGKKAVEARAKELSKSVDELSPTELLDVSVSHFKVMKAHYQEGLGYVLSRLGKDGPEDDAIWKRLPEPKTYFTTLLLIYPTTDEGQLNKEALGKQIKDGKLKLIPWRFSTRVYDDIWKLNDGLRENNLSLASQDIRLECKVVEFQNISPSAAGPAIWQKNDTFKNAVLAQALPMYEKLIPFREMTTDQLRTKLGLGGSATEDISSDSFQDMLDQV